MNSISSCVVRLCLFLFAFQCVCAFAIEPVKSTNTQLQSQLSGGETTIFSNNANAFSLPAANMPLMKKLDFSVGNSFFRSPWVVAPSSTAARDGLGPLFNTNACQNCHIKDGRGHAPLSPDDSPVSLLVRLSIPETKHVKRSIRQGVIPEPTYGDQLQDFAIPGVKPEGRVRIVYTREKRTLAEGEEIVLRRPSVSIQHLAYGKLHKDVLMSARIAPPMIGLGLLEAIDAVSIVSGEDPHDKNKDGISGKANWVWSDEAQALALGRFGWKAGRATLREQNAAAFNGDIGITSRMMSKDHCTGKQNRCSKMPNGGAPEVSNHILDQVTFYALNLAVPARRGVNNENVANGEKLFMEIGCADCHRPKWQTSKDYRLGWLADQTIFPFTDMLLHDMGDGLADNRPEFLANGREWRTPPLWGIGLTEKVGEMTNYLHDGRAETIAEAILWHGGEAEKSQTKFSRLAREKRAEIVKFLRSL